MKNINFIEVGMENFGPYIDPMILEFQNDSLTLLTGPNGIGKTMSLDALPFTLFGSTSKGARGDDVVNNVVGKNCHTWVKLTIDEDYYVVDRYHKYKSLGNTVTISKNKKKPYKKGQKEVLPEIEKLLCPKKSFMNTLMFGQKIKDFFTDLVDSDKKDIFRKILNLIRYQKFYDKAKNDLKDMLDTISSLQNDIIVKKGLLDDRKSQIAILNEQKKQFFETLENDIKNLKQAITSNERIRETWKSKLADLKEKQQDWKDIEEKLLQFEAEEKKLDDSFCVQQENLLTRKESKINELKNEAEKSKYDVKGKQHTRVEKLKDHAMKLSQDIADKVEKILEEKSKLNTDIGKHEDYMHNCQINADELRTGLGKSICPTCLREITQECKDILNSKIQEYMDNASEAEKFIKDELYPAKRKLLEEAGKLSDDKRKVLEVMEVDVKDAEIFARQDLMKIEEKLNSTIQKVEELAEQQLQAMKKQLQEDLKPIYEEREKLASVAKKHQNLDQEIDEIEMTITTLTRAIIQKELDLKSKEEKEFDESQISFYKNEIRKLNLEIEKMEADLKQRKEDVEIFEFWKAAFSPTGIPSMLIDEAIPFMNRKVSEYLDKLTNGRYVVSFDTLAETKKGEFRDKISVNVLDTHTRASSRIQLSGGQTRIIDIATILTLGDLQSNIQNVKFNILLFDEIFDSLDEENIGFVSKVLSNMKFGKSIYLISHRHEDQLEADEVLTLH